MTRYDNKKMKIMNISKNENINICTVSLSLFLESYQVLVDKKIALWLSYYCHLSFCCIFGSNIFIVY